MNRIILIGNGFDLAHGMKTNYVDFLKNFWENTIKLIHRSKGQEFFENEDILVRNIPRELPSSYDYFEFKGILKELNVELKFKNKFLHKISESALTLQNWVDIEYEYYEELKKLFDIKNRSNYSIDQLNQDFVRIKNLLNDYLSLVEKDFNRERIGLNPTTDKIAQHIFSNFKLRDFSERFISQEIENYYNKYLSDVGLLEQQKITHSNLSKKSSKLIRELGFYATFSVFKNLVLSKEIYFFDLLPERTLFLNFNYTSTALLYTEAYDMILDGANISNKEFIHIHGTIGKEDNNPIIFGFGDELDEDYNKIERLNNNKYLENTKSVRYLDTANYKRLLKFINSGSYQILVMGHSCGISDRTLLNTLFENDSCASIKTYYYQESVNKDNFGDLIKNISRNFNDKSKMRDRVVNKMYCDPLVPKT